MPAGNAASIIQARNVALYVDVAAITFDASTSLDQEAGGASIFKVKNMTLTPPSRSVEKIDLWGEDTLDTLGSGVIVTGTFQHQAKDIKSMDMAKVSFTLVYQHDEAGSTTPNADSLETLFHGSSAIDIADTPAFTRFVYGDSTTSPPISIGTLIFVWNNGAGICNAAMVNVEVTKMGDIKPTGSEGHWEQEVEAMCLAKDFALEKED